MDTPANDASAMIANPFYAVTFASHVFKKHSTLGSKEDWVAANAYTMNDISPKIWLDEFLDFMTQSRAKYDGHDILNPMLVINVSDGLGGEHEPLITRDLWIQANEKMITEIGPERWLWQLLEVLETGDPQ
jgi:hypothetical protein